MTTRDVMVDAAPTRASANRAMATRIAPGSFEGRHRSGGRVRRARCMGTSNSRRYFADSPGQGHDRTTRGPCVPAPTEPPPHTLTARTRKNRAAPAGGDDVSVAMRSVPPDSTHDEGGPENAFASWA